MDQDLPVIPNIYQSRGPDGIPDKFEWWGALEPHSRNPSSLVPKSLISGQGKVRFFITENNPSGQDTIWRSDGNGKLVNFSNGLPEINYLGWSQLLHTSNDCLFAVGNRYTIEVSYRITTSREIWFRKDASSQTPGKWEKGPPLPGDSASLPDEFKICMVESRYITCVLNNRLKFQNSKLLPKEINDYLPFFWDLNDTPKWQVFSNGWGGKISSSCPSEIVSASSKTGNAFAYSEDAYEIKIWNSKTKSWLLWRKDNKRDNYDGGGKNRIEIFSEDGNYVIHHGRKGYWYSQNRVEPMVVNTGTNYLLANGRMIGSVGSKGILEIDPVSGSERRLDPFQDLGLWSFCVSQDDKIIVNVNYFTTKQQYVRGVRQLQKEESQKGMASLIAGSILIGGIIFGGFVANRLMKESKKYGIVAFVLFLVIFCISVIFAIYAWFSITPFHGWH